MKINRLRFKYLFVLILAIGIDLTAQRIPILNQIDLPHNYYFRELYLPQLTSGPSSVSWSPDGSALVFSMGGSLWKQSIGTTLALQLTDGNGYDYQPDWSLDGKQIIFSRYNGSSIELMLLDLSSGNTLALTDSKGVNLEARWSPDGKSIVFVSTAKSGHFLLYKASISDNKISEPICLTPDRRSSVQRYYYSAFDHAVNPVWSRDGKEIYFISNHEIAHGTGDLVSIKVGDGETTLIHHEETNWQARADISPDGSRFVYSSYLGKNWHQLSLLPAMGGHSIQLTYGEYDNSSPRWSPDGKKIAFISNRTGNTSLWIVNAFDGGQKQIVQSDLRFLQPRTSLTIQVEDETGKAVSSRISITDERGKFYAPLDAWIQADDARFANQSFESHYFHYDGPVQLMVPKSKIFINVSHGPEYEIVKTEVDVQQQHGPIIVTLKKLVLPESFGSWWSGDVHVHMNYGGRYRNTPAHLIQQAKAENLNFVYNLIVNKEQRIIDYPYFSTSPDLLSTDEVKLLHGQEFHTSYWGHLGLLGLNDHLILPDYSGYPQTAVESLFPNNNFIADRAHEQNGLVGYVHPFEQAELFPDQSPTLTNELPVEAALGKVDYYEVIGFAEHKASEYVWYKLLSCGFRIPAAAGTDAMANYASLRGPVGMNRVYVKGYGPLDHKLFEQNLKAGKSFVTNGPMVGFNVEKSGPGDSLTISPKGQKLSYSGFVRSSIPVEYVEVVLNGEVVATHSGSGSVKSLDVSGSVQVRGPGWMLFRAWSKNPHPDLPDMYAYASTNPIYIQQPGKTLQSKSSAEFFLKWLNRLEAATKSNTHYRSDEEKEIILSDIAKAKKVFEAQFLTR